MWLEKAIRVLILQFMEDLSDRQMEAALQENNAMKLFCGYELTDKTPDHGTVGKTRDRFGTKGMELISRTSIINYKRLLLNGKKTMVGLVALMRKIIVIANAKSEAYLVLSIS